MNKRWGSAAVAILAAMSLVGASSASAATEVGNSCAANDAQEDLTVFQLSSSAANPLPLAVPAAGVVTKWKVEVVPFEGSLAQKLTVLRPTGSPNDFQAVGESSFASVVGGSNVFDTRIPVQTGDRFGLFGSEATLVCETTDPADVAGFVEGSVSVGSSQTFKEETEAGVPVSAVIEVDADGDGYGDETQDKCPQSAAYQTPCPTIALDAFPIVLKRSVLLLVSASSATSVNVYGEVGLGPKPKPVARGSKVRPVPGAKPPKQVSVSLSGGTQTLAVGQIGRFNVTLPKSVKRRLGQITPKESLTATITASTTDVTGKVTTKAVTVRLRGQKRNG